MKNFKKYFKNVLSNHYVNYKGFKTDKRLVIIESDDWGAVRTPSNKVLKMLSEKGFDTIKSHYMQNDALASECDLVKLFEVLQAVKDKNGKHPIFTANTIIANPDFDKIKISGYKKYDFEWFPVTLVRYPKHKNSFKLWKYGIARKVFYPQLHGREHLQVQRWMRDLQSGNSATLTAFGMGYYGLGPTHSPKIDSSYLPAYDFEHKSELSFIIYSIKEAVSIFEELFGYKSISFVAPNYVWNYDIEEVLHSCGVKYIQSGRAQILPEIESKNKRYVRHYMGESNSFGQIYLVRNCSFEPSSSHDIDWVEKCMREIRVAFLWNKPAIIESHRVNYVGFLNEKNRDRSLKLLDELLKAILREWPDVEFMSSDQLGDLIAETKT